MADFEYSTKFVRSWCGHHVSLTYSESSRKSPSTSRRVLDLITSLLITESETVTTKSQ